ncbi:DNA-J related domain-containing protein [Glaciecola sp. SC05]|uniref:DNA-J related domain-containing protein n=1 Tax=Glaciecola sp. SC05 TaxID=1987355 RepID=UPI003528746F
MTESNWLVIFPVPFYYVKCILSLSSNEFQSLLINVLQTFRSQFIVGISEFELIRALQSPPFLLFDNKALQDPLVLFQTHFVLFHSLYHLRQRWRAQNVGELDIGLTQIVLKPTLKSAANIIQTKDPLADYYLDWTNFSQTDADDVENLLNSFWEKMAGTDLGAALSETEIEAACRTMEMPSLDNVDVLTLKHAYRRLQHQNHPDKGGNIEKSQAILQAYTQLYKHLSKGH